MRLAIINITAGGFSGGYKKYLINMIPRLANHKDITATLCIWPKGIDSASWFENPVNTEHCRYRHFILNHFIYIPERKMKARLKKFAPDIIFIPVDRYLKFDNIPVVNMLRNMEPHVPALEGDPLDEVIKKYIQYKLSCLAVRLADQTIAVSRFVESYIADNLKVSKKKVTTVYHGTTPGLYRDIMKPAALPVDIENNFLFTCGSIRPARGLEDIVEALCDERIRRLGIKLVIAGDTVARMNKYRASLERLISLKGLTNRVIWAGFLNDRELYWCFNKCRIFLLTSRIEACPNIAIEALSSGVLSIVADNPPLPEFFDNCASYYPPGDANALSDAILKCYEIDGCEKSSIATRSKERSLAFSWDLTLERTISALSKVLNRPQGLR